MGDERHFGQVYNVGHTEEITIRELAERVIAFTGSESSILEVPYEEAYEEGFEDMMRRVPDTARISGALGWAPTRTLDDILGDIVAYETTDVSA